MGLYGVIKSVGMGCGALWGREVSGLEMGLYGVVKSVGLEMGLYGVLKSVGMGCGALWGREVIGNGDWGSMGS